MKTRLPMFALLVLSAFSLGSCGYSSHPLYSNAYHTISVPVFTSKDFRREWEMRLTEALKKNIEYRTPYKVSASKPDTILSGEIVSIQEDVLTQRLGTNLPRETQVTVVVNFTWKDHNGRTLVERKNFNRSSTEIPQIGERVEDAEQLAIERLASAIVDQMQTPW